MPSARDFILNSIPRPVIAAVLWLKQHVPGFGTALQLVTARFKNREGVIARGPGQGLRFQLGDANLTTLLGTYEPDLQDALMRYAKPGMVAYDIGANNGFLTLILARLVGPTGRVVAFEPNPQLANLVLTNADLNELSNICVVERAVADECGPATFLVEADAERSRLISGVPSNANANVIKVEVISIDEYVFGRGEPAPGLIKIDVEGAEGAVITGMDRTLARHRPIVLCEAHGTVDSISALLEGHNYTCVWVGEVSSGPPYPFVIGVPR